MSDTSTAQQNPQYTSALEQLANAPDPTPSQPATDQPDPAGPAPGQSSLEWLAAGGLEAKAAAQAAPTKPWKSALETLAETPDPTEPPDSGVLHNSDGSTAIVPRDGEDFSATMARAAAAGRKTTPAQVQASAQKGVKDIPQVLASAALTGIAGPAALAAPGEIAAGTPAAVEAIQAMAKAHPIAAAIIKRSIQGLVGAEAYKHSKWLLNALP